MVIQNGPAFFDRTNWATSPRGCRWSAKADLAVLGTEQSLGSVDVDGVVQDELVDGAPLDLGRGGRESEAGQLIHAGERQVQQQGGGDLRAAGGPRLRARP